MNNATRGRLAVMAAAVCMLPLAIIAAPLYALWMWWDCVSEEWRAINETESARKWLARKVAEEEARSL